MAACAGLSTAGLNSCERLVRSRAMAGLLAVQLQLAQQQDGLPIVAPRVLLQPVLDVPPQHLGMLVPQRLQHSMVHSVQLCFVSPDLHYCQLHGVPSLAALNARAFSIQGCVSSLIARVHCLSRCCQLVFEGVEGDALSPIYACIEAWPGCKTSVGASKPHVHMPRGSRL